MLKRCFYWLATISFRSFPGKPHNALQNKDVSHHDRRKQLNFNYTFVPRNRFETSMASPVLEGLRSSRKGNLTYDKSWYEEGRIYVS